MKIQTLNWREYKKFARAWDKYLERCEHGLDKQARFNDAKKALNEKLMHKTILRNKR